MLLQVQVWSMLLLQEAEVGWDPRSLWHQMGSLAKFVVVGLFFMSAWSIGVMIDRLMSYSAARKQSRAFTPAVAGGVCERKMGEGHKKPHPPQKNHLGQRGRGGAL